MAAFAALLSGLRRAEKQLGRQLEGVRSAISSLEFGGAVSPAIPGRPYRRGRGRPAGSKNKTRKRRKLSAKARAAISAAQKARWAKVRAAAKKKV